MWWKSPIALPRLMTIGLAVKPWIIKYRQWCWSLPVLYAKRSLSDFKIGSCCSRGSQTKAGGSEEQSGEEGGGGICADV